MIELGTVRTTKHSVEVNGVAHTLIAEEVSRENEYRSWRGVVSCTCGWTPPDYWSFNGTMRLGNGRKPHFDADLVRSWDEHIMGDRTEGPLDPPVLVATVQSKRVKYEYWVFHASHSEVPMGTWFDGVLQAWREGDDRPWTRWAWVVMEKNSAGWVALHSNIERETVVAKAVQKARNKARLTHGELVMHYESDLGVDYTLSRFVADFVRNLRDANPQERAMMLQEAKRAKQMLDTLNDEIIDELMGSLKDG